MFAIYAKDIDNMIGCSDRYQETEFLGIFSTLELAKKQIEFHKADIQKRINTQYICIPSIWRYYIYSCKLDQTIILNEYNAVLEK